MKEESEKEEEDDDEKRMGALLEFMKKLNEKGSEHVGVKGESDDEASSSMSPLEEVAKPGT